MSKKTLLIIIGAGLLFLALLGGGFYMIWTQVQSLQQPPQSSEVQASPEKEEVEPPSIGPTFPLETFVVNLADPDLNRYLRVTMELEMDSPKLEEEMNKRLPQIRDTILRILPEKRSEKIQSAAGKTALRQEIMTAINAYLRSGKIVNLYFTEFVIQ